MDALLMCGGRGTRLDADGEERDGSDARPERRDGLDDASGERSDPRAASASRAWTERSREKPLVRVGGRPMVDRVRDALAASRVGEVHAVVSPHAPATRAHLADDCRLVDAPGEGYVADLTYALDAVGRPALTAVADLPLLAAAPVDRALAAARGQAGDADDDGGGPDDRRGPEVRSLAVHVPAALKRALGASVDATVERDGRVLVPAGLNVVADGPEALRVSHDARLAVNVNRPPDIDLAEALCD